MRLKLTLPCSFRELPAELSQYTVLPAEAAKRGAQWALPVPIPRRGSYQIRGWQHGRCPRHNPVGP
jgi:hypothetical protein